MISLSETEIRRVTFAKVSSDTGNCPYCKSEDTKKVYDQIYIEKASNIIQRPFEARECGYCDAVWNMV